MTAQRRALRRARGPFADVRVATAAARAIVRRHGEAPMRGLAWPHAGAQVVARGTGDVCATPARARVARRRRRAPAEA